MRRLAPRPASTAVAALAQRLAPRTLLADVQAVWPQVAGDVVAANAEPTAERDGVLTVTCSSAVWAQELDLMGADVVERLNAALTAPAGGRERPPVSALRCRAAAPRGWS